jgi:hypothetical protein
MSRMLLCVHHVALCTTCTAIFNHAHLLHIWVDHVELKSKIQAEQVQKEYDGPQAPSYEDANIVVIKESPGASNHRP